MTIKKSYLETLFLFTKGTENVLNLADSRLRDTFIKPLFEITKVYIEDRNKIYLEYCLKNEDGSPELLDGDKYQFPNEKLEEINKELEILGNEEVEVGTHEKLKEILEKSEYKPKVGEAEIIDEILAKL